ncbi:hypothetical protein CCACVL1_30619 [Corchorus capsularis]|uniref:TF-B3 domain-containing protein n=1 Tax=Corchorus capsularis TaxID=210143 RepID=A0A1R3FWI9_COCAP|nr:hypothetical protein CCACVL1_30619 [Corchorus capsularis]
MNSLFRKQLSKTDVEKRLAIPTSSLQAFNLNGACSVGFEAEDMLSGRIWQFHCTTRTKGFYSKPVISKGWVQFVKFKQLRVGDRVAFYKLNQHEHEAQLVPYKIEVERKIELLGKLVWAKV